MANTQTQFGFRHIGFLSGYAPDYQLNNYQIASTNATKIGYGDPVMKNGTTSAFIIQATAAATATQPIVGIFQGCYYVPSGGGVAPVWSNWWPGAANANATAYVIDAPGALFLAAALNTAISSGSIGNTINFSIGTPSTVGAGLSTATLDQSTLSAPGTTASNLPFKVVSLYQGVGNGSDPTTSFNWAVVTFNFQQWKTVGGF
jgi:hypothetical protein